MKILKSYKLNPKCKRIIWNTLSTINEYYYKNNESKILKLFKDFKPSNLNSDLYLGESVYLGNVFKFFLSFYLLPRYLDMICNPRLYLGIGTN